jgi:hypothetical protein
MAINTKATYREGLLLRPSLPLREGGCCNQCNAESFGGNSELAEHADRDFPFSGDSVAKLRPWKLLPRHAYP